MQEGLLADLSAVRELSVKLDQMRDSLSRQLASKSMDKDEVMIQIKVTGHAWQRSSENRHCALNISPIFIKFSPIIRWCM